MTGRYVVFGGGGLIGGHVARWLAAKGHTVRIFDLRIPKALAATATANIEFAEGNYENPADVDAALEGVDTVLHFISLTVPSSSIDNVPIEIQGNLAGTVRLLDLMAKRKIRKIGYPSSGGTIYGAGPSPHKEDEPPLPTCPYGFGKLLIEHALHYYQAHKGIDYQIWRIANPYGDAARRHLLQGVIDAFLGCVTRGAPIALRGDGRAVRDFVFVDDVAAAIGQLLERGSWNETINIGSGRGVSVLEVLDIIRKVTGKRVEVEMTAGYTGPSVAVLDSSKLRTLTGWTPVYDLEAGVREAWRRLND